MMGVLIRTEVEWRVSMVDISRGCTTDAQLRRCYILTEVRT